MQKRFITGLALAAALFSGAAAAHEYKFGTLAVIHPWARPTAPGQTAGGAYLALRNGGTAADRLLGGSSPGAARVEVHEMRMDGNVMRMREIAALALPVGQLVQLEPGGLHLMLIGLKAPLKAGDKLPLKLRFERAGEVEVVFDVENPPAAAASAPAPHKH